MGGRPGLVSRLSGAAVWPPNVYRCQILGEPSLARCFIYRESAAINAVAAALQAPS
jgi:hypothetical protein